MTCYDVRVTTKSDRPIDKKKCREFVYGWVSSSQCSNKAKYFRQVKGHEEAIGFCGVHDPERKEKKNAERREKWAKEYAERKAEADLRNAEEALKNAALEAIRQIASGHNGPRALALSVLAQQP